MIGSPLRLRIGKTLRRVPSDALARVGDASSSFVTDAMSGRGVLDYQIAPLEEDWRIFGSALTAFVGAGDNLAAVAALDYLQQGDILVIGTGGSCADAVIGDNMGSFAKHRGAYGIVTDGAVRDANELVQLGLPCFCCGLTPRSAGSRGPGEVGLPMAIGGAVVSTGDLIVADRDGVIAVPHAEIPAMLDRLDEVRAKETAMSALLNSEGLSSMLRRRFPDIDAETEFVD